MSDIKYKVLRNGRIAAFLGERQLSKLMLNEPVPFVQRGALRTRLDRDLFRATLAVFGTGWVPADYNEMLDSKKLVKQLAADKVVKLVPLVLPFIQQGYLKASPGTTALKRLKKVMMRVDYTPVPRGPNGAYRGDPKRPKTDVNRFWEYSDETPALTEAGWRFLCRQSTVLLRELTVRPWQVKDVLQLFNMFPAAGIASVTVAEYALVDKLSRSLWRERDSFHQVLLAWKDAPYRGNTGFYESAAFYQQVDVVADWLRGAKPVVTAGATWLALLTRALDWAATVAELESADVEQLKWPGALEPFVANDGLVVTPIVSGVELLEEGRQMKNCLAYQRRYAEECVKGLSQIFRIQGVSGRATVQFERRQGQPWKLTTAEEKDNTPVTAPPLRRAIDELKNRMEVSA